MQNKIKQVNYFSSTNNKGFWLPAQPQKGRVQKPHVFEAPTNTFCNEPQITREPHSSNARQREGMASVPTATGPP